MTIADCSDQLNKKVDGAHIMLNFWSKMSGDEFLRRWKKAGIPPSDCWDEFGRRVLKCRVQTVSISQQVQGYPENEAVTLNNRIFYELRGGAHSAGVGKFDAKIDVLPLADAECLAIKEGDALDEERAGFGYCYIEQDEKGAEQTAYVELYVDTSTFDGFGKVVASFEPRRSLFINLYLQRPAASEKSEGSLSLKRSLVTYYQFDNICELA